jgi:hypothetical protein
VGGSGSGDGSGGVDCAYERIYVCGDSHSLAPSWRLLMLEGRQHLLVNCLVTGLKHWHLRREGCFFPKTQVLYGVPITPLAPSLTSLAPPSRLLLSPPSLASPSRLLLSPPPLASPSRPPFSAPLPHPTVLFCPQHDPKL